MSDIAQPIVASLGQYLDVLYSAKTRPRINRLVDTVGTAAVQIVPNDPKRLSVTVVNMSSNTLYVAFSNQVSSSYGVILTANGGILNLRPDIDFDLCGWELWAVASGASSAIHTIEVLLR